MPANVLDLSPAFRNLTNGRQTPEGKGLLGALRYFGLDTIDQKKKDAMRDRIMRGWPFTERSRNRFWTIAHGDVEDLLRLLPEILARPEFDLGVALYHGEFAAVSALMEHHGVPIDMEIFSQLADKNTWRVLRDAMVPAIDAQYGVYVRNDAGDWAFNMERFERLPRARRHCRVGHARRTASSTWSARRSRTMTKGWPQLEELAPAAPRP